MKPFDYFLPQTLREAIALLSQYGPEAKILAGGTDLLVEMKEGRVAPQYLIDLKKLSGLNRVQLEDTHLAIGALTTIHEVETNRLIREYAGILAQAASVLGSLQIRNKGTIGGNICHASPSADLAPALLALGGRVKLVGKDGERMEELESFLTGPGKTALKADEILAEIEVPLPPPGSAGVYLKFTPRRAMDLAVVGVATVINLNPSDQICSWARIALGAVAPAPIRARKSEKKLLGQKIEVPLLKEVSELAAGESRPISDVRGSAWYRKELTKALVERGIREALERINPPSKEDRS